jgi:hypothetical protein
MMRERASTTHKFVARTLKNNETTSMVVNTDNQGVINREGPTQMRIAGSEVAPGLKRNGGHTLYHCPRTCCAKINIGS